MNLLDADSGWAEDYFIRAGESSQRILIILMHNISLDYPVSSSFNLFLTVASAAFIDARIRDRL